MASSSAPPSSCWVHRGRRCRRPYPVQIVVVSEAFPRAAGEGVNVVLVRSAQALQKHAGVVAVVPTPWVPKRLAGRMPQWNAYASTPATANYGGLPVWFPRYLQVPTRLWRGFNSWAGASMALGALPLLRRLRREGRCDVLFGFTTLPDGLAAMLLGRWLGIPVVCLARGLDVNSDGQTGRGRRLTRWTTHQAVGVAAVSHDLAARLRTLAELDRLPAVLYQGVDLERFVLGEHGTARHTLGIERGEYPLLLYIGRLAPEKRLPQLIDAFSEVVRHRSEARLALVGSGALHETLVAQVNERGLRHAVHFAGEQPYDRIPLWLRAADLVVLCSASEGFPSVVREALACGRPVVTTAVGELPRIVTPQVGRLIEDPSELAEAILDVLGRPWDAAALRSTVAHLTWEEHAAATYRFIADATALR